MPATPEELEQELVRDLEQLAERFADEEFSTELYRALANNVWRRDGGEGGISLSWRRAEELVNDLRGRHGQRRLELAQTGGEGEVSELVRDELGRLGWSARPLDTDRHEPQHLESEESPPPREQAERMAPDDRGDWEREAHREAEQNRRPADGF